jgi:hypothetical protein
MRGGVGAASSELRRLASSPISIGVLLALMGLMTWTSLSLWGGLTNDDGFRLREAWDTQPYFYVGLPVMSLAVAAAAFVRPERPWRWALWLVGGHQLGVVLVGVGMQSAPSLLVLTIILAILFAVFFAVPAVLGAMAARALGERAY